MSTLEGVITIISILKKSNPVTSIEIIDGSLLYITELHTENYQKYSYHWQKEDGQLIIRWDNSPHWKNIKTFPHHKHEKNEILPSHRISIQDVIEEITKRLKT